MAPAATGGGRDRGGGITLRVMQIMAGAAHGGAEEFFVRLTVALARAGLDQRAVIRHHLERTARLRAGGVPTDELRFGGLLDLRSRLALRRLLAEARPDVAVTWMSRASAMCPRGPFVQIGRLGGYYDLKHYRRCTWLVGNTPDLVRHCVEGGWPADRVRYLPNFPDAQPMPPVDRAALDTPADAPVLLAMGRLHVNKGFDILIDAFAAQPRRDAILWLAGEGPLRGELAARAAQREVADRIRFLGWRQDVPALLAAADLFVCPSRHEPLGNVVIEAWAHGAPVVAAAAAGPASLIEDGVSGLLVPVDDAGALAAAIGAVLADDGLRRRIAENGRARHAASFTEAAVVRDWLAFLHEAAERRGETA